MESKQHYTQKQLDVLNLLIKHYRQGVGPDDPEIRRVADSIIDRGTGVVELIDSVETSRRLPAMHYRLTDAGAEAFRAVQERRSATDAQTIMRLPSLPELRLGRGGLCNFHRREKERERSAERRGGDTELDESRKVRPIRRR
jgi:hypothetical protein